MNRNNIWIHVGIAVVLITFAGILGQIERWKTGLRQTPPTVAHRPETPPKVVSDSIQVRGDMPEVLVRFKPGVKLSDVRSLASKNNDSLWDEIESVKGLTVIDDLDNADAEAVARQYAALTDLIEYAEVNPQIKLDEPTSQFVSRNAFERPLAADAPNDPLFGDQWALNNTGQDGGTKRADLDALNAWASTKGSEEVVVAVLDSGVDYKHEDLVSNMWERPAKMAPYRDDELGEFNDAHGFDGTSKIGDPMDDNGHGTHCAGIIGAEGDNAIGVSGINQKVKIMPLKFLGRGGFGSTDDAIAAINYAIERKKAGVNVRIISASWGSTSRSKALEDTIKAAGDAGILFIAAAGNDGSNNDSRPHYPSNYDLPNVISVAALDRNDKLASFSNFGEKTVHIAAPGKEIVSTWLGNNYREASGTSMATPYVSGVAALIIASDPQISMKNLRTRLLGSVDELDSLKGKVASGGRLCAANSLGNIVKEHSH
jgi:thermitase